MNMTIGSFLIRRLTEIGLQHIFGVPGDFNLAFLEQIEERQDIEFIGNTNELNASYAADGYARTSGIAGLITTWGVGDMSAIGGIAGAYAERIPVVHMTGLPPLHAVHNRALLHHTLADGSYGNIGRCMAEFTVAQTRLTPENAVTEIDRVLQACWRERRPVHIQIPSDITHLEVSVPDSKFILTDSSGDAQQVELASTRIVHALSSAKNPVILFDADADRFGVIALLAKLSEKCTIPYASLLPAKAVMDETNPLSVGVYIGAAGSENARQVVEESDCLIGIGIRWTDTNSGFFTQNIKKEGFIDLQAYSLMIGGDSIPGAPLKAVLQKVLEKVEPKQRSKPKKNETSISESIVSTEALSHEKLWPRIERFFRNDDVIIGEAGSSHTALSGLTLPKGSTYIAQPVWGAIGYTLPALFGSQIGKRSRRHILFIGDGSFQLTVQELSSILRHNLKPIIFLINNRGYTVERVILGENSSYNDIANWQYSELPRIFNAQTNALTRVVETEGQLEETLKELNTIDSAAFIELKLPMHDAPKALKKFGVAVANYDYGSRGPRNESQRSFN